MTPRLRHWLAPLCSLVLAGCLLPQPDTPPIPPTFKPPKGESVTAPAGPALQPTVGDGAKADTSQPGMAIAPARPGTLTLVVSAGAVAAIAATTEDGGDPVPATRTGDTFALTLAPGDYRLAFTRPDTTVLLSTTTVHVASGDARRITVSLSSEPPTATLSEELPLEPASPMPSPSPTPRS